MTNQPNKATVKDGLPTAHNALSDAYQRHGWLFQPDVLPSGTCPHEKIAMEAMQSYSDQQNAELREENRNNQSRWAKDRVAQDKKHDADMMEACGKIVDLEERVKELEAKNESLIELAERSTHYVSYTLKDDYQKQLEALKK